jgi:beta-glucanase (GH16 family)
MTHSFHTAHNIKNAMLPLGSIAFAILLILSISSCKEDPVEETVLPSNLVTTVDVSEENKGEVNITAQAENTNYYSFTFDDNGVITTEESNDGQATYTYALPGEYQVSVKAHITGSDFIESIENITIEADEVVNDSSLAGFTSPESYAGWDLVWRDEFDGNQLSSDWTFEIGSGNSGWGNNELQYYRQENTTVANGVLTIEVKNEPFNNSAYTSSRIITQGAQSFKYGRVDIRARLPFGQGMWPALWMLGDNISSIGWPRCGEIDIMEIVGGTSSGKADDVTHGTIHWDNDGTKADFGGSTKLSSGRFADEFHVFSIIWDEQSIKWLLDNDQFHEVEITSANMEEFHEKFFFIFNVAVGGNWPGSPDASTVFPQNMKIDYIRVFQEQ